VTTSADCRLVEDYRNRNDKRHAQLLIGAAFLLVDQFSATTMANAQSSVALPAVTVESPTQRQKLARPASTSAQRTQAAAARQRNRNATPAQPSQSERAAAAAAALNEAKLG
jgi:iron complex outermembrane receptor protein